MTQRPADRAHDSRHGLHGLAAQHPAVLAVTLAPDRPDRPDRAAPAPRRRLAALLAALLAWRRPAADEPRAPTRAPAP